MERGSPLSAFRPGIRRAARPRGDERGAALVEFAIVLVLLALILFGITEFGFAYNNYISVRNGSREGARLAVVDDVKNAPSCSINGAAVTPPANPGNASDATNALVCKTKDRIGLDPAKTKVKVSLAGTTIGQNVTVCASYPVDSVTGLLKPFLEGRTLVSEVVMRLEQPPAYAAYSEPGNAC